jgi:hypothetical protein
MIDNSQAGNARTIWVAGLPEHSIWTGLKLKGRTQLQTLTYRCTRCGYLESYAPSPDAPENILLRPAQATETPTEANHLLRASAYDEEDSE